MPPKKQKQENDTKVYAGSETRIILFAITCFEWQAEIGSPVDFTDTKQKDILTPAMKYQFRDFDGNTKPYQFRDMHNK